MSVSQPKTLDDVCEFIVDCLHATAPTEEDGYPLIRTPNIGKGRLDLDGVQRVSENTYQIWTKRAIPIAGDLILAREAPAGNVAIIKNGQQVCLGQRTVHLRPNTEKIDPDFLCYFLLAPVQQGKLLAGETGATSKHVNMKDIRSLGLTGLPILSTQRAAGEILSKYDDLIENNNRRIDLLEKAARTLFEEWFVRLQFPGREHTKIRDGVPEGWKKCSVVDICEDVSYGYTASASDEQIGPKFLRITDIVPTVIDWERVPYCPIEDDKKVRFNLVFGDVVVARTGATTGYAKLILKRIPESVFASYLVRFRPKDPSFAYCLGLFMESDSYKEIIKANVGGAAQPNANAKILGNPNLLVPSKSILESFNEFVEPLFTAKEILQMQNQKLKHARDLLLPKLMTGAIQV